MPDWGEEIRKRLAGARMSPAHEADVVEELAQHLEDRHRELLAQGVSGDVARQQVLEELSQSDGLVRALEEVRPRDALADVTMGGGRRTGRLHGLWQDVRYSLRVLWKTPTFTVAALLALGLGAGAATAVFSLLDGVVLRPLPFRQPDRLVMVWETNLSKGLLHEPLSPVNMMDYRALGGAFQDMAAWWRPETNLIDRAGEPVRVQTVETSENLFKVLGVDAALGRTFPVTPALFTSDAEAVISDRLWRDRFGADPGIIGRAVQLNASPYVVVGVMPRGFHFPANTDVWQRLQWDPRHHSRDAHFMEAVGRLRDGATIDQANHDLAALTRRLGSEFKHTNEGWGAQAIELNADVAGVFRPGLFALFGASGLLLLIACINVANLLLARGAARQPEVAVRAALGATRFRLMQQFLVESLLLATFGTLLGFIIAALALRGFLAWTPIAIPRADEVHINLVVLAFTATITVGTAIVFGLAPAFLASRADLQRALKANARGSTGERAGKRARSFLVVSEIALAVALLAGAGLLIRSVAALMNEKTGVGTSDAVVVDVQLSGANYRDWTKVAQFYSTLITNVRAQPRVVAVGASNFLPLEAGWRIQLGIAGRPDIEGGEQRMVQYHIADDGYFAALGAPVLRGRAFDARDTETSPGVVVINQTLARRYWPREDPVGRHILNYSHNVGPLGKRLTKEDDQEVIGVVADVKNNSLKSDVEPALYSTARQYPFRKMYLVVRGTADAATLVSIVRAEVKRLDAALPLGEPRTIQRVLAASADPPRFVMLLMSVFAALALVLAAIGVYGILSYTVHQRGRELGIRMALGARPRDVLQLVVREGVGMGVMGACFGVIIAISAGKVLSSLLYNVKPVDPVTLAGVVVLVLGVALVSCVAPGRRAAHTDPVRTLRGD